MVRPYFNFGRECRRHTNVSKPFSASSHNFARSTKRCVYCVAPNWNLLNCAMVVRSAPKLRFNMPTRWHIERTEPDTFWFLLQLEI